ncbi:MAG: tetratricopeptide repeat protein [Candidatus Omnitrophica bacterium]|nr:tetratricopeptide repeat protein [Candidatus Omnitrophota bacterium]
MGKNGQLVKLRLALDEAITYGTKKESLALAREGVRTARRRRLAGEEEYFRGQIDILHNRFSLAIEHFDKAIAANSADGASYNDRALCMVELGVIDEALVYFNRGIRVEPDFATIHHNKGWLLNNIGRHSSAIRCFRRALKLDPHRAVTYDNLADAYYNLGDYRKALRAYERVLELLKPGQCRSIRAQIRKKIKQLEKK